MIRLALIDFANEYASIAPRVVDGRFVAVVHADSEQSRSLSDALGASIVVRSFNELLKEHADEFDAIVIHDHIDACQALVRQTIESGKHVLIDSPIALSKQDADAIINEVQNGNHCVMMGQPLRFLPSLQAIKDAMSTGKLGDPGLLRVHRWQSTNHGGNERELLSQILREIDLANWLFADTPTEVYAISRRDAEGGSPSYVQVHLGFPRGGMAMIDYALTMPGHVDYFSLSMIGSAGAAYVDDHHNAQLIFGAERPAALITQQGNLHLLAQLNEFIAAIRQNRSPAVTHEDACAAMLVAGAVIVSMSTKRVAKRMGAGYELV